MTLIAGENCEAVDSVFLPRGKTLDGKSAEMFVRYRSGYLRGDLGRVDAQKLFMAAFLEKATSTLTPVGAVKILRELSGEIETDLSLSELSELAVTALGIKAENVTMLTLAGEDIGGGAWYYVLSRSAAERALREYVGLCGEFDREGLFYNASNPDSERIYLSDIEICPSSASDISQNGLEIEKR